VLGANDGIISTAGLVIGVAAATTSASEIATAGVAGVAAGAVSMALGEFVSVSSQRDSERALIAKERGELRSAPDVELAELIVLLQRQGLSDATARAAAAELTAHDVVRAHLSIELGIDERTLANPWTAALSSAAAFIAGAVLPLVAILVAPASVRIMTAFGAVLLGLLVTGWVSARLGHAPTGPAIRRLVAGGALAMVVTFAVGYLFGAGI
jgi:VIT1/CCC1 family predicted Fe2+/Mn2+ transporter